MDQKVVIITFWLEEYDWTDVVITQIGLQNYIILN